MSLPPHFLDELRDRVTVSSVIGRKYKLERKGREFLSLCPFHNDSKPSLSIVDDKGFYHCFACGAHGDVFKFLMENDGLKFMEAVEQVAALAGLEVPKPSPEEAQRAERHRSLQEVVDLACRWYERQLHTSAGEGGLRYLKDRGLCDETIRTFRLGWAPDDRKALQRAMKAEGVETGVLVEAGLVKRYEDGERAGETVDYMRGRVLFPITDRRGKVIAFGGRVLGDGQPKYLNSPDTPLFHKGRVLYGLAQAREPAHKSGELLVAEGYMDVIALAQAGFPAVAPLGTALTEDQIAELWRITPEPILCFDGDTAGQRAARRACDRALPLLKPGHSLRFITLPEGQDPDDLIKREGTKALRDLIVNAEDVSSFIYDGELEKHKPKTPLQIAEFSRILESIALRIEDRKAKKKIEEYFLKRFVELESWGTEWSNTDHTSNEFNKSYAEGYIAARQPLHGPSVQFGYHQGMRVGNSLGQQTGREEGFKLGYNEGRFHERYGKPYRPKYPWKSKNNDHRRFGEGSLVRRLSASGSDRIREEVLILTIINHPTIFEVKYNEFMSIEFIDDQLNAIRLLISSAFEENNDLDREWLISFIDQNDKEDTLGYLLSGKTEKFFRFCREDALFQEALDGWDSIYDKYRRTSLEQELDRLVKSEDLSLEERQSQINAIHQELEQLNKDELTL